MHVGLIIDRIRKERKMTLSELSAKSGVALATLSRMKHGKMTGTLESHMAICEALGINLPELYKELSTVKNPTVLMKPSDRADIFVRDNKSAAEILTSRVMDKKMMPVMIKIESKGNTQTEENKKSVEKFIYILSGKVEAVIGDNRYSLNKNDTLYFDSSLPHNFRNIGPTEVRLICVTSPPVL